MQALTKRYPGQVLVVAGDLTEADQVRTIGIRIGQEWGALDSAILNAGTCEYVEVRQFEAAMFERMLRGNLMSAAYCIEAALPLLRKGDKAHLVAVTPLIELDGLGQMTGVHYSPRLDDIPLMSEADTQRYHAARKRLGAVWWPQVPTLPCQAL